MCHQTVSLVQTELERRGIVTVSLTVMADVTAKLAPPRALAVPTPLGAPMGPPHEAAAHEVFTQLQGQGLRTGVVVLHDKSDGFHFHAASDLSPAIL